MKSVIKTLCITIFSFFLFFQTASAEEALTGETTVGIGQLMNNADLYTDSIMIQGIVSKVFPQDHLIGLIDNPNTQGCGVKKCTRPCDKAASKKCPMKAGKDPAKTCPMADARNTDPTSKQDTLKKCPMMSSAEPGKECPMAAGKECTKTCPMASSKECPMKAAIDSGKACPMAAAGQTDQSAKKDAEKKCPMAADKSCAKSCSMADAKTCNNSGVPLTLPVLWEGDMPEPSSDVRVVGKITNKDGRLLFVAESIKVMNN